MPKTLETAFETYRLGSQIGEGGVGRVWSATSADGRRVAVKIVAPDKATGDRLRRFKNEIRFCMRVSHPNVIKVLDYGSFTASQLKVPFYVMELFHGSLRQLMKTSLPPARILALYSAVLDGVEAAHLEKVVHRDLKPENVLVDENGGRVVVADFGIARFTQEDLYSLAETRPGQRLANFLYASPEQRSRGTKVDQRADLYALGLVLNEMFTGEVPQGTNFSTIGSVSEAHAYLDPLIEQMLRQDPNGRPGSIAEIKCSLIAQGRRFVAAQKVSRLTGQTVPEAEVDDPLIADPMQLIDFDWTNGILTLILSQATNPNWAWAIRNMGGHSGLWGKSPDQFRISGNQATIEAQPDQVQDIINYFKRWLPRINEVYERRVRQLLEKERERKLAALRKQQQATEARLRLLRDVEI